MASTLTSPESSVDRDVCRLCRMACSDFQKFISEENSDMNEVYRITLKYFPAKFLEPRPEVLCWECWQHIIDFNGFQETIFDIQKKLFKHVDESKILDMSSSTTNDNGFDIKPNVYNKTVRKEHYSNENCQNAGNTTADVNKEKNTPHVVPEDDEIEIFLSDLGDIDIQFSTDDEMSVSESVATIKKETPTSTTSQCSSSKDCLNGDDKATSEDDEIDKLIRKHKPKLYCWICSRSFLRFQLLATHFRNCHRQGQCYISCCKHNFTSRQQFWDHIALIHKEIKVFKCGICKIIYATASGLSKHEMQNHCFHCPECQKVEKTRDQLEKHYNAHFVCSKCNKGFQTTEALRSHTQMVHTASNSGTSKPIKRLQSAFSCKDCGKRMDSKTLFDNHVRYAHNEVNKYKCKICEKAFKKVLHFRDHMNTHTTENYYACPSPHCTEKLQYWSHLEGHLMSDHGKKFTEKNVAQLLLKEEQQSETISNPNKKNEH